MMVITWLSEVGDLPRPGQDDVPHHLDHVEALGIPRLELAFGNGVQATPDDFCDDGGFKNGQSDGALEQQLGFHGTQAEHPPDAGSREEHRADEDPEQQGRIPGQFDIRRGRPAEYPFCRTGAVVPHQSQDGSDAQASRNGDHRQEHRKEDPFQHEGHDIRIFQYGKTACQRIHSRSLLKHSSFHPGPSAGFPIWLPGWTEGNRSRRTGHHRRYRPVHRSRR